MSPNTTSEGDHIQTAWTGWHPGPNTRGTWDIYTSCVITIGLCVWQAIHLNIPPIGEPAYKQTFRKLKWMVFALIAPECVVANAISIQYAYARHILKSFRRGQSDIKRSSQELNGSQGESRVNNMATEHSWNMECAFYASSGGIVWPEKPWKPSEKLTYGAPPLESINWILRHTPDLSPQIHRDEVVDKGKANNIAKAIVCIQALWFCTECVTRLAQTLPLSLLELNTFAHCICAFLIYAFWWKKPYDVSCPTVWDGARLTQLRISVELNMSCSWTSNRNEEPLDQNYTEQNFANRCQTCAWGRDQSSNNRKILFYIDMANGRRMTCLFADRQTNSSKLGSQDIGLRHGDKVPNTEIYLHAPCLHPDEAIRVSPLDHRNWQALSDWVRSSGWTDLHVPNISESDRCIWRRSTERRSVRHSNWQIGDIGDFFVAPVCIDLALISTTWKFASWTVVGAAGAVYGGLHLLAWSSDFPSGFQRFVWRFSGIFIAGSWPMIFVFIPPIFVLSMGLLARCYLIVEAFIALLRTSDDVYRVPTWSVYWPHIS